MNQSHIEAETSRSGERSGDERIFTLPYFAVRSSTLRVSIMGECQICLIGGEPRRPPSRYIWINRTKTLAEVGGTVNKLGGREDLWDKTYQTEL